jgi:hypothetical protein
VDLSLARKRQCFATVTVCTSDLGCSNSGWGDGRIVFIDAGAVGAMDAVTPSSASRSPERHAYDASTGSRRGSSVTATVNQQHRARSRVCNQQMQRRITVRSDPRH